jgi:hypothetical protein
MTSGETATEIIRVSKPTKTLLENLKIVERDTYDAVINRVLETKLEECMQLNPEMTRLLQSRLQRVKEGKVLSGTELVKRFEERRHKR